MEQTNNKEMEQARKAYNQGDYETAHNIWLVQANNDNAEAQAWLGAMYANGDGVDVDDKTALSWYEKAANED